MDKQFILERLHNHLPLFQERYGISRIGLFGSFAKGIQNEESDIDLIYELAPGVRISFRQMIQLEEDLKNLFAGRAVDFVNYRYLDPIVMMEVNQSVVYA